MILRDESGQPIAIAFSAGEIGWRERRKREMREKKEEPEGEDDRQG